MVNEGLALLENLSSLRDNLEELRDYNLSLSEIYGQPNSFARQLMINSKLLL